MIKKSKWVAMALTMALVAGSILTGCSNQSPESGKNSAESTSTKTSQAESSAQISQQEETSEIDISERVDLVLYQVGEKPNAWDRVEEKINEILLEKVNATISFTFTTWTDYKTKYNLALGGGENVDLAFTATWLNFFDYIDKGAYLDLTPYIEQYAPDIFSDVPEDILNQCYYTDGGIYATPSTFGSSMSSGLMYREDLREKYDLPVPDSIENMELYMQGIKDNMPTQQVTDPRGLEFAIVSMMYNDPAITKLNYGMAHYYDNPSEWVDYYDTDMQLEVYKLLKKWADAGYWSRDALADASTDPKTFFTSGKTVLCAYGTQVGVYEGYEAQLARDNPDWEIAYVPYADINGIDWSTHPQKQGVAIAATSKNPERAMMVLNLLYTDEELNHLVLYGFEGEHYTIDEDGYYTAGPSNADFGHIANNAWGLQGPVSLPNTKESELRIHLSEIASKTKTPYFNFYDSFPGVMTNTAGIAALSAVESEHLTPLQYGLVDDVEAGLEKFMEEAEKVGLKDIQAEYRELWTNWCNTMGY